MDVGTQQRQKKGQEEGQKQLLRKGVVAEEDGKGRKKEEEQQSNNGVPLMALNHVSRLCKSVEASIDFYTKVLGFVLVARPPAFETFGGSWLFNYGVGIHLVQKKEGDQEQSDASPDKLDPMDNHISFQCEDMRAVERRLKEMGVEYLKRTVDDEEGSAIDQLFFNDPNSFMIEICNCENVELVPARPSVGRIRLPRGHHNPPVNLDPTSHPLGRDDDSS